MKATAVSTLIATALKIRHLPPRVGVCNVLTDAADKIRVGRALETDIRVYVPNCSRSKSEEYFTGVPSKTMNDPAHQVQEGETSRLKSREPQVVPRPVAGSISWLPNLGGGPCADAFFRHERNASRARVHNNASSNTKVVRVPCWRGT